MGLESVRQSIQNLFWTNDRQSLGFQHFLHRRKVSYPMRLQEEYVFVSCLAGEIQVTESGQTCTLHDGEVFAGNSLCWRSSEYGGAGSCEGLSLVVSPKLLPHWPLFEGKRDGQGLRRLVEDVLLELASQQAGKQELLEALAREFLVRALRLFQAVPRPEPDERQRLLSRRHYIHAIDFMQGCPKNDFSLDKLSHQIGIAPADFSRLFRLSTGQTPLRVYNQLLISQAEEVLLRSASVKEVAYQFGFQSPSHFTALYRKVRGHSPSELRLSKS